MQRLEKKSPQFGAVPPPTPPESDQDCLSVVSSHEVSYPLPPPGLEQKVLDVDKNTPDSHVPRDPRLIRLTGVHPFNVEAPLTDLFDQGFLTGPDLFYVRNHGAVPQVHDDEIMDWEVSVEGEVQNPFKISLREILKRHEQVTYPITLVCAGNRRKEQNIVRKTKGFSWGAAGVSTALWTGIPMAELIRAAKPKRKAKYVCMEGADKLPNGFYGTSVKLNWVLDPNRGILLAHKMNGENLTPDHGKPFRAVIPGQIGGRSVKWLKKLIITEQPSDNWYHIYDNRVLPTMISPEQSAKEPETWKDERYAIYDLSCNSAIAYPGHEEQLSLIGAPETYKVKGYAYGGGGRRITRVEISTDKGKTWTLAEIDYPEDRYREADDDATFGGGRIDMSWRETCFAWCFWCLDIAVEELSNSKDILVRCMDESMTIQPRDMYWSVLGMMNNPWFRVTITKVDDVLKFEHPTQPALMPGGWMERVKKSGGNLINGYWGENLGGEEDESVAIEQAAEIEMTKRGVDRVVTIDEFREHEAPDSPWFVLNGHVYDGTSFLEKHPGGSQSIISAAGQDATDEFMAIHSETAKLMMPDYHVGCLDDNGKSVLAGGTSERSSASRAIFLEPRNWNTTILHEKKSVSWDTRVLIFKLDHDEQSIGLPVGQHLMIRLQDPKTKEAIIRSYTPISHTSKKGYLEVLVKIYFDAPGKPGGKLSQALERLSTGQAVDIKGPIGKFNYVERGRCTINGSERFVKRFIMICGGSGVTPIFQVFRAIMEDKDDPTQVTVLNGNRLEEDILCREDIDGLAKPNLDRCKVINTLTKPPENWTGLKGRIAEPLLQEHAQYSDGSMALICGPGPLEQAAHEVLLKLGWKQEDLLFF